MKQPTLIDEEIEGADVEVEQFEDKPTFYQTDPLRLKPTGVEMEEGIIRGAAIAQVGEARGHEENVNEEFVENVVRLGNERTQGTKVRLGHPNESSTFLDTPFVGRAKNFRKDGDTARADIHLSESARTHPMGDVKEHVLSLADIDPDMFGMSIVFKPGASFKIDADGDQVDEGEPGFRDASGPVFATIKKLMGADVVDEAAATDGLFENWSEKTLAGAITKLFDEIPDLPDAFQANPELIELFNTSLPKGIDVKQFIKRYEHNRKGKTIMSDENKVENNDTPAVPADANTDTALSADQLKTDLKSWSEEFGAEKAVDYIGRGLTHEAALVEFNVSLKAELEAMKTELATATATAEAGAAAAADAADGEDGAADFAAGDEPDEEKVKYDERVEKFTGPLSPNLARYAAGIKLPTLSKARA